NGGTWNEGTRNEGTRNEGTRNEGTRNEGTRNDRNEGTRNEGTQHEGLLPGDARTVRARLWLAGAAATGLAAGLELLGVGAPSRLLPNLDSDRSHAGQRTDHEGM